MQPVQKPTNIKQRLERVMNQRHNNLTKERENPDPCARFIKRYVIVLWNVTSYILHVTFLLNCTFMIICTLVTREKNNGTNNDNKEFKPLWVCTTWDAHYSQTIIIGDYNISLIDLRDYVSF